MQAQRVAEVLGQHVEAPLLAEETPGVGEGAERAAERRIGGELRLPLGAELPARAPGASRETQATKRRTARHGACPRRSAAEVLEALDGDGERVARRRG